MRISLEWLVPLGLLTEIQSSSCKWAPKAILNCNLMADVFFSCRCAIGVADGPTGHSHCREHCPADLQGLQVHLQQPGLVLPVPGCGSRQLSNPEHWRLLHFPDPDHCKRHRRARWPLQVPCPAPAQRQRHAGAAHTAPYQRWVALSCSWGSRNTGLCQSTRRAAFPRDSPRMHFVIFHISVWDLTPSRECDSSSRYWFCIKCSPYSERWFQQPLSPCLPAGYRFSADWGIKTLPPR